MIRQWLCRWFNLVKREMHDEALEYWLAECRNLTGQLMCQDKILRALEADGPIGIIGSIEDRQHHSTAVPPRGIKLVGLSTPE